MAIEYRLTLAGDIPLEEAADLAAPNAIETRTLSGNRMLTSALHEECGYVIDITAGSQGYYDAEDDGSLWVWEPDTYIDIDFHMRKDSLTEVGIPNMLATVGRVLRGRTEDAALVLNGNVLLLTRTGGEIRKHNQAEWYDEEYDNLLLG